MNLWDKMMYDPLSAFSGLKWWQVILFALPWALLLIMGSLLWFLMPGKKTSDYNKQSKNVPLDTLNTSYEVSIKEFKDRQIELQKQAQKQREAIMESSEAFEKNKKAVENMTHEEIKNMLYNDEGEN